MEDNVSSAGTSTDSPIQTLPQPPRSHRVHPRPSPLHPTPLSSSSQLPPPILPVRSPLRPPARSISNNSQASASAVSPVSPPSNTHILPPEHPHPDSDAPVSPQTPASPEQDQTITLPMTTHPMPSTPALRIQMRDREREREREKDRDRDRENAYPYINELIDPLLATIDSFSVDLLPAKADREREGEREYYPDKARGREREIEKELPERPETPLSIDLEAEDESSHSHSQHAEHDHDDPLANPTTFTSSASAAAYMSSYMSSLTSTSTASPSTSTSTSVSSSARSSAPTSITSSVISSLSSVSESQLHSRPQKRDSTAAMATTTKPPQTMSKRHHAMHELLSSERAYASDLALIKEVHIPLALGQTPMLQNIPLSPPPASGASSAPASNPSLASASSTSTTTTTTASHPTSGSSSTRTLSTASDSSTASLGPAMSPEDVKVIFGNIEELALLSDAFADRLEVALGSVLDGGEGDDTIGALFLECVPTWERPYKQYITRHPSALQHLQNLPQTPALAAYLAYTQRVASALSHAWDLASLLIKPVQRLLKYPLLLHTIIDETPDAHPDKENLRAAKERIEELARNVNEGRRRAEVVKDVLTSKGVKKPSAPVGVSAGVSLSKVKSLRHGGVTAATMRVGSNDALDGSRPGGGGGGSEAALVDAMQGELKQIEVFAQQFARNVVDWGKMMSNMMLALRTWALSFAKVIGLALDPHAASAPASAEGQQQHSEAFDAFLAVIREKLMPLSADLEAAINERLLKDLAHLLGTMTQPLKLLASMGEQEPYHYHLLTMPLSAKNRPPAALLAASTNYLALRGQLAAELPAYLRLLHRGFGVLVRRLAELQTRFWRDVKEHWAELWDMLRVESELNVGWEETCAVWCARWADVDEVVKALAVTGPVPHLQPTPRTYFYTYQLPPSGAAVPAAVVASPPVPQQQQQQTELAEYFAYPNFYMPMSPAPSTPKDRRESASSGNSNSKLEKHNSKSSGHSGKLGAHHNTSSKDNAAAAATVQSMFAALEPAHSPVHHKKSTISNSSFASSLPAAAAASSSTTNVNSTAGFVPSMASAGSLFGGGASMYSVSGPLPLGSVPVPRDRDRDREGRKEKERDSRGRGRGASDASSNKAGYGTSGRRPASQDRQHQHQHQQHFPQSPPPPLPQQQQQQHMARSQPPQTPPIPARRRTQGHVALADEFAEYVAMHGGSLPPPYEGAREYPYSPLSGSGGNGNTSPRQGISRMKSMPVSLGGNGHGHVDERDREVERVYRQEPEWEEYDAYAPQQQQRIHERGRDVRDAREHEQRDREFDGRRLTKSPKRRSKEQTHSRKRSGSVKSITAFFTSSNPNISSTASSTASASAASSAAPQTTASSDPQPLTSAQRDSWASKPAKYFCQVIHPCRPPPSISYYSFPFFTLREGELYEVLQEAGHPSIHPKLPLYVDDGEDCLLLCRDGRGVVGWALASFLEPVEIGG